MSIDKIGTQQTSPTTQIQELRWQIEDNLRRQKISRRELKTTDLEFLENTYHRMAENKEIQANKHLFSLLGFIFKLWSCKYAKNDPSGKLYDNIGDLISQGAGVTVKFSEGDMTRFEARLTELRELLNDDNKREDEIKRLIQEINQMLDTAIEKANRSKSSAFNP